MALYRVVELFDPREPRLPRAIFASPCNQSPWLCVWQHRNEVDNSLSAWFRGLSESRIEPVERVYLGRGGLPAKCCHAICKYRIGQVARMAGTWPDCPDFLTTKLPSNTSKHGRVCFVLTENGVQKFPSIAEAGRHLGVARETVSRAIRHGLRVAGRRAVA